jgi:hypothetical protein
MYCIGKTSLSWGSNWASTRKWPHRPFAGSVERLERESTARPIFFHGRAVSCS